MDGVKMSQKEYLRKYLSSNDDGATKKKKKKKQKIGTKTVKIIDDDVDVKNMRPIEDGEFDIFNTTEDAPQIVGVVDERGPVDFADKRRWKIIADDGEGNVACSTNENKRRDIDEEIPGEKSTESKKSKKSRDSKIYERENSNGHEISNRSQDSDASPPRKSRDASESDLSPPRGSKKRNREFLEDSTRLTKSKRSKTKKLPSRRRKESSEESSPNRSESSESSPREKSKRRGDEKSRMKEAKRDEAKRNDSDLSPPRESRNSGSNKKSRNRENSESDLSPPRESRNLGFSKKSRNRENSESDLSPPRESRNLGFSKKSRNRENSESDLSPPRQSRNSGSNKKSRNRENSESDLSPPRQSRNSGSNKKSRNRENSESDLSPPRRSKNNEKFRSGRIESKSLERMSKKSRGRDESRNFNEKSKTRRESDSDFSPPRRSKNDRKIESGNFSRSSAKALRKSQGSDSDLSPPRLSRKNFDETRRDSRQKRDEKRHERPKENENSRSVASQRHQKLPRESRSRWNDERSRISKSPECSGRADDSRMKKTLDGKTAGLQDARALRIETEAHKKREAEMFKQMSAEVSGVGQTTVLRDRRTGRRRDLNAEAAQRREKEKRQEEIDEKYAKWGKGLKQVDDQAEKLERDLYEMSKPLARYADDADLDKELREAMHIGDPMMDYIKSKQIKEGKREPERPSYQGSFMPNRFGIKPGHRWDGVDRSNGYEKKWFDARNARTALQEEAYKWSTADM